jgi:hypothetical protein
MIAPPLVTHVEDKMSEVQLKEGQQEKTKNWTQEVAKALAK